MKIQLARIDDRFIHGQVLTKWVKQTPIDRIIIVSDGVAEDEMRKTLVLSVAPAGIKASAVGVDKMVRAYNSPRYVDARVMLLFENPQDVLRLVEEGVPLETINVGGMRFENGRTQITQAENVAAFRALAEKGIELDLRQLPSDRSTNFIKELDSKNI